MKAENYYLKKEPVKNKGITIYSKKRQGEKKEMVALGFKTKKAYRKWQKKQRPCRMEES